MGIEEIAGVGEGCGGFVCVVLASKSKEERTRDTRSLVDWMVSDFCDRVKRARGEEGRRDA